MHVLSNTRFQVMEVERETADYKELHFTEPLIGQTGIHFVMHTAVSFNDLQLHWDFSSFHMETSVFLRPTFPAVWKSSDDIM